MLTLNMVDNPKGINPHPNLSIHLIPRDFLGYSQVICTLFTAMVWFGYVTAMVFGFKYL